MVGWSLSMVERRTVSFHRPRVKESELSERLGAERYGQLWPKALMERAFWGRASRVVLLRGTGGAVLNLSAKAQLICAPLAIQLPIRLRSSWVICVMLPSGMICEATAWAWIFGASCWICCGGVRA